MKKQLVIRQDNDSAYYNESLSVHGDSLYRKIFISISDVKGWLRQNGLKLRCDRRLSVKGSCMTYTVTNS